MKTENNISKEELQLKLENAVPLAIIDVRSKEEYDESHIPEAIHLPLDQLKKIARFLNCNALYVTACGKGGGRSAQGAEILTEMGLKSAWLIGGTFGFLSLEEE
jgi:rhodanese-related sulfurtransferase